MQPARTIESYLNGQGIPLQIVPHPPTLTLAEAARAAHIELNRLVRAVMLRNGQDLLMAVLPANYLLDFTTLGRILGHDVQPALHEQLAKAFPDCEPGSIPPLGEPYGLPAIIDEQLVQFDTLYFEPGSREYLVKVDISDFLKLHRQSRRAIFSRPTASLASHDSYQFVAVEGAQETHALYPLSDMQEKINRVQKLPPLPQSTRELLRLRNDSHATIAALAAIIATDPSLAAQVVRYARSAYYGYRGRVDTLHDAITRVLGFDMVLHMALGLTAAKALQMPADGPLGQFAFWRHSVYTASLAQALNTLLPPATRGKPGLAYLAGLLHDFGFMLLGHLFSPEFFLLNKAVAANPGTPVMLIEKRVLGVEHTQLGAWLMSSWGMPDEICIAALEHHNEYYRGPHASYANLVLLADHLLKGQFVSDASSAEPPPVILTALGLDADRVVQVLQRLLEDSQAGLDEMVRDAAA